MWNLFPSGGGRGRQWLLPLVLLSPVALLSPDSPAETVEGEPDAPLVATVVGTEIRTRDPEEMRYWILRNLTDRYAAEKGIEVAPQEIDAYVESMARVAEKDRKEREGRRAEIEQQLGSAALSDAERKDLSSELDSLKQLQSNLEEMSGGDAEETRQARRTVAEAFIRQWKINQALYREYDGRIIFQQGGPEPLDAYRKFLEEREGQGDFQIRDKDFEAAFWRYYITDSIHSFYPPGSEEENQAFETPWWFAD
jgi:hypothetical protein